MEHAGFPWAAAEGVALAVFGASPLTGIGIGLDNPSKKAGPDGGSDCVLQLGEIQPSLADVVFQLGPEGSLALQILLELSGFFHAFVPEGAFFPGWPAGALAVTQGI